jgi:hypothetical protein
MPSPISKALIAALAFGAVNALPQPKAHTPRAAPTDNTELIASVITAPTTIKGFRKLLTDGQNLLSGDDLIKATIFDFNDKANTFLIPGSEGGSTSGVSTPIYLSIPFLITDGTKGQR